MLHLSHASQVYAARHGCPTMTLHFASSPRGYRRGMAVLAAVLLFVPAADAAVRRKRPARPSRPRLRLTVKPSAAIEARVEREVAKGRDILDSLDPATIFDSPYLISAIYYHDGFLDDYPDQRPDANPARRIVARLSRLLTPERKNACINLFRDIWDSAGSSPAGPFVVPVHAVQPRARRRTHRYAIDLFAPEGSPVVSAGPGLVLLAESGWTGGDPFSASSQEGGNSIIVFDPGAGRFYRYCHLASVNVSAGQRVDAGQSIGRVGHSGANASRRGHGRHLHFEINQYDGRSVRPLTYLQLRGLIQSRG